MFATNKIVRMAFWACLAIGGLSLGNGIWSAQASAEEVIRERTIVRCVPVAPAVTVTPAAPVVREDPIVRVGPVYPRVWYRPWYHPYYRGR
jgi:hypothetical protein